MAAFGALAASADWLESMLSLDAEDRLPADWREALALARSGRCAPDDIAAGLDPLNLAPPARWAEAAAPGRRLGEGPLIAEIGHVESARRAAWIAEAMAAPAAPDPQSLAEALVRIVRAEVFEAFMARRYAGRKRFGCEGAEGLHVVLGRLLDGAVRQGVREVVIAPMHRGRLSLHAALLGQPLEDVFALMDGAHPLGDRSAAGDVPYHLGLEVDWPGPGGSLRVRLLPNPSHLEAVSAVALGLARRRQEVLGGCGAVLPILLHTDASVVAQGVVAEALQLSEVDGHRVRGAVHLIVNNQIGFTTDPCEGRSSRWCTGPFKAVDSLILHVNGDRPEAAVRAADLALAWRGEIGADSAIDLICLRANGHNELDEPRFTQPAYYARADRRPGLSAALAERLSRTDPSIEDLGRATARAWRESLEQAHGAPRPSGAAGGDHAWPQAARPGLSLDRLVATAAVPPPGAHPKVARAIAARRLEWEADAVSWATAEVLAFGAVLSAGRDVRLAGQDSERGAFSQRHLAAVDAAGVRHRVFDHRPSGWGRLSVVNTPLCEYAALGFEYGYALAAEGGLTLWEAQFGDFANVAQPVFDQFIAAGREKWGQACGLTVLLPHGLEGQGPEHSSARIERLTPLAAKGNLRIAHPSTPANWFHLLLGQTGEDRPLIALTPKKLLRHKAAVSPRVAFETGRFEPVIATGAAANASRVVVCSGKIALDVEAALLGAAGPPTAVLRLELLYPFPDEAMAAALACSPDAEVVWLQEEPQNHGAGAFVRPRLEAIAGRPAGLIARPETLSPAGGFHARHDSEQAALVAAVIGGERR